MEKIWTYASLKMKMVGCILSLLFANHLLFAQDSLTFHLEQTIPIIAENFTTDKLQNCYVLNAKKEVIKYNAKGQESFRYSNTYLDEFPIMDATDPFNLLLYYSDYQTIITLDRTLSQTAKLDLLDLNLFRIPAVALASDNKIWLYDAAEFKLKKINHEGAVISTSDDLSLLLSAAPNPNFILEREQRIFVNAPALGILVFDFFGQFMQTIPILNLKAFQIIENQLIFSENGQLKSYHLQSLLTTNLALPKAAENAKKIVLRKGKVYVQTEVGIQIFSIN